MKIARAPRLDKRGNRLLMYGQMAMKSGSSRGEPIQPFWDRAPAAEMRQDCFADEVAIDFPSVGRLVERACARLVPAAERTETGTMRTDLWVSSDDATRGTVISLAVPIRSTCRECGGRGEIWADPCLTCGGTGGWLEAHPLRVRVPPNIVNGARLRFRMTSAHAAPVRLEVRIVVRHESKNVRP